ncbi:MAG: hypothetical protein Q8N94_06350 [Methanoregula sp.]|nr:hypothetical protein [Methanoregula sp.]
MGSKLDSYIIAKFAQWALDNEYYEKKIKQFHTSHDDYNDPASSPDALAISAINIMFDSRKKDRAIKNTPLSFFLEDNYKAEEKVLHNTITRFHTRGTFWKNSEVSFVLKMYLTDLEFAQNLQKNVHQFLKKTEYHPDSNDYWGTLNELCFSIKMNEMFLIEIFVYSCNPKWQQDSRGIKELFEAIMQIIDPDVELKDKS